MFPNGFISSISNSKGFDSSSFEHAHQLSPEIAVRINPFKSTELFDENQKIPWTSNAFYLKSRPDFIFDPLWHAGAYYVQEPSSMFLEHALNSLTDLPETVFALDLCAAPGGKSTLISSFIGENGILVANEVVKQRAAILSENMIKWNPLNTIVTNVDPSRFEVLSHFFDLIVADVPCSGSGLFRKDPQAMNEWSQEQVAHCSLRQRRIVADCMEALKPGGYFIYSTCSYSEEENETNVDWIISEFGFEAVKVPVQPDWGIVVSVSEKHNAEGYRFYPGKARGEGFFLCVLRKPFTELSNRDKADKSNLFQPLKRNSYFFEKVKLKDTLGAVLYRDGILIFPRSFKNAVAVLCERLFVLHAGCQAGKLIRDEFIPDHPLAMVHSLCDSFDAIIVSLEQAIRFLRKEDMQLDFEIRGWNLVRYNNFNLGWIKGVGNRINNYYPRNYRILKSME